MAELKRVLHVPDAIILGLGSMMGTGVFVSLGLASALVGSWAVLAVILAGVLAFCNGLSSAQLASKFPVSGGAYEYANRLLHPSVGFLAGWLFLIAKSASAASAALGFSAYIFQDHFPNNVLIALLLVLVVSAISAKGLKRSNQVNKIIVSLSILSLTMFVSTVLVVPFSINSFMEGWSRSAFNATDFFEAIALSFVAFTGYGRIATMGEEIQEPRKTIPLAILFTVMICVLVYSSVLAAALSHVTPEQYGQMVRDNPAPLSLISETIGYKGLALLLRIAAAVALFGVLLNLILGLSRVVLAMGRRGDLPVYFQNIDEGSQTPVRAILFCTIFVMGLVLLRDIKTIWSVSALSVLVYYGLNNLAALRLGRSDRMYPVFTIWLGLFGCGFFGVFVDPAVFLPTIALVLAGFILRYLVKRFCG